MKKIYLALILILSFSLSYGAHLKGGWIYYEYLGQGSSAGTIKYRITVKQYLSCSSSGGQIDASVFVGVFNGLNNQLVNTLTIPLSGTEIIQKSSFNPCITSPPVICYRIDRYVTVVDLPENFAGYTLAVQRCCRIAGIINVSNSSTIGVSYTTSIPGIITGTNIGNNNSAQFAQKDTVVVCYNGNFTFDFSATDVDNDSLVYSFCDGLVGGGSGTGQSQPNPPSNPPYNSVPYNSGYSGLSPMGPTVTINPKTGLISGTAPGITGDYVVAVCVSEFRNGVKIGETKKEIHITVAACGLSAAELKPNYITCDGFTLSFQNESTSASISLYAWNFGNPASGVNNTSSLPTPTHTFTDTGVYTLKLNVENTGGCKDSATALVKVFPGFFPNFQVIGNCFQTPFQFLDRTTTAYGFVDSWRWDFGDLTTLADTSIVKNPTYTYPTPGTRTARLIVTNSKGCVDTTTKPVVAFDLPPLDLPFHDTLICSIDTLPLIANGSGNFLWTPNYNIISPNTSRPFVYPKITTTYIVTLNQNGCINKDSIKVNVLDFITVDAGRDTSMCKTDTITLKPISQALQYLWSPASSLNNATVKNPLASPSGHITYYVTANLGKCQDKDSVKIKVTPYPMANAEADTTICYGDRAFLRANITGSSFIWSPSNSLLNPNTLTPVAGPQKTTSYILTVFDTVGCPKPSRDTVTITVLPKVIAYAGRDTSVVANQPLQLFATGGTNYVWSPITGMNNPNINNPVVVLGLSVDSILYKVRVSTPEGCFADDDVRVKVFKTGPEIFVPSAFTPNRDGRNDILKPIPVGIKRIDNFSIYNRWGQLLFTTTEFNKGWDGTFGGKEQASGTYVYMAQATDYLDQKLFRKGTIVLIR